MNIAVVVCAGLVASSSVGFVISYFLYMGARRKEPLKFPTYRSFVREHTGYNFSLVVEERRRQEELAEKAKRP